MEKKILLVINMLNQIEVKGSGNLNKLLGCIQALNEILNELTADPKAQKEQGNG